MDRVQIFWDPGGFELDSLGEKQYLMTSDGDTPFVSISIRMLSIDTPEIHYPGNSKPSNQDANFAELAEWIRLGKTPVSDGLAAHLYPRLATGTAGTLHEQQGEAARTYFQDLITQRLTRPNGTMRRVFLYTADTKFDQYGRLLAYMAPYYSKAELQLMSLKDRATFNLLMVESGWAASFIIYPSLPKYYDLVLMHQAAQEAFEGGRGAWADLLRLTGYEFRMCVKLHELIRKTEAGETIYASDKVWVERFCADMTTKAIYYPEEYYRVPPYNRIFIWSQDVNDAVGKLGLVPGM